MTRWPAEGEDGHGASQDVAAVTVRPGQSDPIRVEHVGSLVRPAWLEGAELGGAVRRLGIEQVRTLQDRAVVDALRRQRTAGLPLVTDGELRRLPLLAESTPPVSSWQRGWARRLVRVTHDEGLDLVRDARTRRAAATATLADTGTDLDAAAVTSLAATDEYRFAAHRSDRPVKVSLLGPERAAQGLAPLVDRARYGTFDALVDEVVRVEREVIADLAAAGCTHVQLDVPGYATYEDPSNWAALRGRGIDPRAELVRSIGADNAVAAGHPGVTFGLHLCRRGIEGRWRSVVANDAVAETVLNELSYDRLLFDFGGRGPGFDHLRFVPPGRIAVLGLVSTTDERVETADDLVRRVEEATAHLDVEQLAIGPQCGFAGPVGHRDVSEGSQWRKLDALMEAATRIWG